jgi:hypothetical protein
MFGEEHEAIVEKERKIASVGVRSESSHRADSVVQESGFLASLGMTILEVFGTFAVKTPPSFARLDGRGRPSLREQCQNCRALLGWTDEGVCPYTNRLAFFAYF